MEARIREAEKRLEDLLEVRVAIEEHEEYIVVSGLVADEAERNLVIETLGDLVPEKRIEDNLEVTGVMPERVAGMEVATEEPVGMQGADPGTEPEASIEPGDFTDQGLLKDPGAATGPNNTRDDDVVAEGDTVFVPPTDPVRREDNEVLGGFSPTSFRAEVPRSSDGEIGDEAIAAAVRRELSEDAATTHLDDIRVAVRNKVVFLRGRVGDLDDAENAEEVAARIPGVEEVREELEVADLE